jgi:hypothetical protein
MDDALLITLPPNQISESSALPPDVRRRCRAIELIRNSGHALVRARPLDYQRREPNVGAQPQTNQALSGAAKPRPTSGGKAESMLAQDFEGKAPCRITARSATFFVRVA